jgi:hypothetical protein
MNQKQAKIWFLWDLERQKALGPYSESGVMAVLQYLGPDHVDHLLVWTKGWETWTVFRAPSCEQFLNSLSLVKEPTQCPPVPEKLRRDFLLKQVNLQEQRSLNLRKSHRLPIEIPCTIAVNENVFHTKTLDVSEGGLRVADPVPDWVGGYCLITLLLPAANGPQTEPTSTRTIELLASLAEDQQQGKTRFQVQSVNHHDYRSWILSLARSSAA